MDHSSTPNITDKTHLNEKRLHFERIAECSHDFIGACDMDGVPIYINPEGLRLVGLEDMRMAQTVKFTDFFFNEDVGFVQDTLLPQVIAENYAEMEIRLRHFKTQEPIWVNYAVFTVKNEADEIVSVATISRNISEQKKNQQTLEQQVEARTRELREANAELERLNRELSSFAYTSSHDLQTPLRKIQAFTSRLLEKESATLSVQGQEYFRRMQGATQQMQTLIEDLLTYSRTGTTEKIFELTNLNALLYEVENELEQQIQDKQATIVIGPLPTLPVIPFQIRQLLSNLLSNALKFSKKKLPPRIVVRADHQLGTDIGHSSALADQTYHHLTISDNGIGFESTYSERIFEVFQRLHGRSEYSGTGIGLAICKKIVEGHQGFITAEGMPGEGAVFHVYLPERRE